MKQFTKAFLEALSKDPVSILNGMSEDEIAAFLQKAQHEYFHTGKPLVSDQLYDLVKDFLEDKNPRHPVLKYIGAVVDKSDERKEKLPYFMASLDKIKTDDKVLEKWISSHPGQCVVSDKLDGNSALLYWKGCQLKLYTRGNGEEGQNISHLLSYVKGLPQFKGKEEVAVRGELVMSKKDFETVKDKGANARNMVAGIINAKKPDLSLAQLVQFVAYEVIQPKLQPSEQYKFLKEKGFKYAHNSVVFKVTMDELSNTLVERRSKGEFEIDGIVVAHDKIYKRVNENPTHAFAFKSVHTMEKAEVVVTHVEWNMSKDGYLIPVVNFNDVRLAGVVIKRAHGFNGKFIKDNVIGPGSRIIIMRSGDVIPYILEIITPSISGHPQMPDVEYEWSKSKVDILVTRSEDNDELKFKNIEYFFTKVDVKGLGPGNVKKMYDSGLKSVKAIFTASITDLLRVDGFKDKTAAKLFDALQTSRKQLECVTIMDASNIFGRGIGGKKIELITKAIPDIMSKRFIPTIDELVKIKGIEHTTAEQFVTNLPRFFEFVDANDLLCSKQEEKLKKEDSTVLPLDLLNKKFVFTGFRNPELEAHIKARGGDVSGTVSGNTFMVVKKDTESGTSKLLKAEKLGIKVVNLSDFLKEYGPSK